MMPLSGYLTMKPQLAEFRSGSDRDTMSEVSDSGTAGSMNSAMGSAEELQKVALILGIPVEDVVQDRFRVDRKKLELMLADDINEEESANIFFQKVMEETSTVINWPSRLKVGAKSKKDPHVRVAGKAENTKLARDKIMQMLDTRGNRVTMKLDLSYTDHSHIIGKGGLTIKRVMEETGCHIHFPDSNRSNPMEKSNQVSIAGDMENVEKARAKVRALTPLIFSFELPIMNASQTPPDASSPYVIKIQEQFNVQVMFRTRPKLHATLVVVKGLQWEVQSTMEATKLLINYMCGSLALQTLVQMSLEITPMHHSSVLGRSASQLKLIMSNTKAQIMFPDAGDPNIPMLKKSNVTITGNIKDVYLARQQLVGSLPLVIMFDLPEDIKDIQNEQVAELMQNFNVFINIRHKPKLSSLSVIIKGIERNAGDIYEARRHLLNLKEPSIIASIPESYHIPLIPGCEQAPFFNPFSPTHNNTLPSQSPMNVTSTIHNITNNTNRSCPPLRINNIPYFPGMNSPQYNPSTPGGFSNTLSPLTGSPSIYNGWGIISPSPQAQTNANVFQYPVNNSSTTFIQNSQHNVWGNNSAPQPQSNNTALQQSSCNHQYNCECNTETSQSNSDPSGSQHSSLSHILNMSSQASSGYHSNFTGSSVSLDTHSVSGADSVNGGSNFVSPAISPMSKGHSPAPSPGNDNPTNNDLITMINEMGVGDRRAPGIEKKALETIQQSLTPLRDYQEMKMQATMAMKESFSTENYRVPTSRWAGYGFSQTSPGHILSPNIQSHISNSPWTNDKSPQNLTRPNIMEYLKTPVKGNKTVSENLPSSYQQLSQLFAAHGLDKYIQMFQSHEVDISTFSTFTDGDLCEIGVTAFGARKKMLLAIAELNKNGFSSQQILGRGQ